MTRGEVHRLQPELADHLLSLRVNVPRLGTVEAVEEEAVRPRDVLDSGHRTYLSLSSLHIQMSHLLHFFDDLVEKPLRYYAVHQDEHLMVEGHQRCFASVL
jgi:hypothetical protein